MMIKGIRAALDPSYESDRLRFVTFLTDGYIGNEAEILGEIHDRLGASRIFSFGVGSSPNRYLLQRMAKLGQGAVGYLGLNDDGAEVMDHFFERISHPVLTDVEIDWGGMASSYSLRCSSGSSGYNASRLTARVPFYGAQDLFGFTFQRGGNSSISQTSLSRRPTVK